MRILGQEAVCKIITIVIHLASGLEVYIVFRDTYFVGGDVTEICRDEIDWRSKCGTASCGDT